MRFYKLRPYDKTGILVVLISCCWRRRRRRRRRRKVYSELTQ
jgi:hypothetical protein